MSPMSEQTPLAIEIAQALNAEGTALRKLQIDEQKIGFAAKVIDRCLSALRAELATLTARCEALTAERDSLLASKQADQERFDRDLANFSAGYTQALDDAATKGQP